MVDFRGTVGVYTLRSMATLCAVQYVYGTRNVFSPVKSVLSPIRKLLVSSRMYVSLCNLVKLVLVVIVVVHRHNC